jgi:hypothetical protein
MLSTAPENFSQVEEKANGVRRILWSALFASQCIYVIVAFVLRGQLADHPIIDPESEANLYSSLRLGFLCLAAVHLWLAGMIRNRGVGRPATHSAARPFQMPDAAWQRMSDDQRMALAGLKQRISTELAAWALSGAAGLYGIVLFIQFGRFDDLLYFIAVAAVGFILNRPQPISRHGISMSS